MTATEPHSMAAATHHDATDAVQKLVSHEIDNLIAFFSRRVTPSHEAADLAAETLLVVWRRASALPADSTQARMWLYGVARKILQSHYRHHRKQIELADRLRDELRQTGDSDAAVDNGGTSSQVAAVRELVAHLPELDRDIVMLHHWDGFSLTEIGVLLHMPAATVRSRYHRARMKLRTHLN